MDCIACYTSHTMAKFLELGRRIGAWIWKHKVAASVIVLAALLLAVPIHYTYAGDLFNKFVVSPLDTVAIILAGIIQNITGAIGKFILLIIESIVIPILGYNGFYNSHITNLGWSLVRDIVNMFVVIVLLVIAVMTIIGYSHANWTQQLPRLFIAIVLVNFSKLICGLAIDISQVIMFTFVNAIVSIAAGNFASMLGLSTFGKFGSDFVQKSIDSGSGVEPFMFLGGAYLQFVIYIAILAVMFLLAVAFIWRIVVLWILIIMAPLAFFSWGIGDVFHSAKSAYTQWMGRFSSALTFGPILVFFLWLSLAASSGSTLAKTEDFPFPDEKNSSGLELDAFTLDNFLGMFLALAILIAGMQQAASASQGMGGFASSVLSEKNGIGAAKWLAKSPFKAMGGFKNERAWVNKQAKAGATATSQFAPGLTKKFGGAISAVGSQAARVPGLGWAGNATAAVGGNISKAAKEVQKENVKHGADQFKERTDAQIAMLDEAAARGKNAFNSLPEDERNAYLKNFGTDVKRREKFMKNLKDRGINDTDAKDLHDKMFARSMEFLDTDKGKAVMDDTEKDRLQDSKFANLHLAKDDAARDKIWNGQEKDGRLNLGLLSNDSLKDTKPNGNVAYLKKRVARRENGKDITAWNDMLVNGKGTQLQRDAMVSTVTAADVTNGDTRKDSLATLVKAGAVTRADSSASGTDRRNAVRTVTSSVTTAEQLSGIGARTYGKAAAALLDEKDAAGGQVSNTEAVFGTGFAAVGTGDLAEDNVEYQKAGAMVEADSKSVRHLDGMIGNTANAASQIATSRVNLEAVKKLQKAAEEEGTESTSSAALKTMEKAVHAEINRPDIDQKERNRLIGVAKQLGTGARYSRNGAAAAPAPDPAPTPVDVVEDDDDDGSDGPVGPVGVPGTGSGSGGGGSSSGSGAGGSSGSGAGSPGSGAGGPTPAGGGGVGATAAAIGGAAVVAAASRINPRYLSTPQTADGSARSYQDAGGTSGAQVRQTAAAESAARVANETPAAPQQTPAQNFVARGRAKMAEYDAARTASQPAPAPEQTAAQKFVARGRAAMTANATAPAEPTSAPAPDSTSPNSRPRSQVRTSAVREPDRYGSARQSTGASRAASPTRGSAPNIRQTRGPGSSASAGAPQAAPRYTPPPTTPTAGGPT